MKKLAYVLLMLAVMLAIMGGTVLAQFGTVQFETTSGSGICAGPIDVAVEVGDVNNLTAMVLTILYDPTAVSVVMTVDSSTFNPISGVPSCGYDAGSGMEACIYNPLGGPVSIGTPVPVANLHITSLGGVAASEMTLLDHELDLYPAGPENNVPSTSLNQVPGAALVIGSPLVIPGCTTAIGGLSDFNAQPTKSGAALPFFAVAGLLGMSGMVMIVHQRRQENSLV